MSSKDSRSVTTYASENEERECMTWDYDIEPTLGAIELWYRDQKAGLYGNQHVTLLEDALWLIGLDIVHDLNTFKKVGVVEWL